MYGGKYRLGTRIGRGGMAEVYRATLHGPDGFEKAVCVKRILPEQSSNPGFEAMFRDEARLAALLRHGNVVQVLDYDRDEEGRLFICMELVEGVNLRRLLVALGERGERPGHDVVAAVARGVLEGLHHAQTARYEGRPLRVIHRDISPQNILLSTSGEIKIADFGIAKAFVSEVRTRAGVVKGKASYMSPEQAAGARLDQRTDLYSLGVVLWEMIAGRRLFASRGDPWALFLPHNRVAPPIAGERPDVPAGLARLVDSLLEVERERRPGDAARALEMLGESGIVPAFSSAVAELVERAMPQPPPDPALLPTEPEASGPPTVRDAATRVETPGSPPEPLDSDDILTRVADGPEPESETSGRRGGRAWLLIPALVIAAVAAGLWAWGTREREPEAVPGAVEVEAKQPAPVPAPVAGEVVEEEMEAAGQEAPAARAGIDVNARPWAEVFVDGRSVGYTPLALRRLMPGRHVVRLVNAELGVERKVVVRLKPGATRRIAVDLTQE